MPATRPHELVNMRGREFGVIFSAHIDRLRRFWTEEFIINIEHQHSKLVLAYQNESALKSELDKCEHNTSFEGAWGIVGGRFDTLGDFCGGIATLFAKTASVESGFSAGLRTRRACSVLVSVCSEQTETEHESSGSVSVSVLDLRCPVGPRSVHEG